MLFRFDLLCVSMCVCVCVCGCTCVCVCGCMIIFSLVHSFVLVFLP